MNPNAGLKDSAVLEKSIRDVPDFPKKGIIFKDITTLLKDGNMFRLAIDKIVNKFKSRHIDAVISVEARGFILGSAVAYKLRAGLVPVRKKGKLPSVTHSVTYQLEYGSDTLEIHRDAFKKGANILIVDDLLATGGTVRAVIDLVEKMGGKVAGVAFLIELVSLDGQKKLKGYPVYSIIENKYTK